MKVWRPEILNNLLNIDVEIFLYFLRTFQPTEIFFVRMGPSHSEYIIQEEGVLQKRGVTSLLSS